MRDAVDGENGRILSGAVFGIEGGALKSVLKIMMMGELPYTALGDGGLRPPDGGRGVQQPVCGAGGVSGQGRLQA